MAIAMQVILIAKYRRTDAAASMGLSGVAVLLKTTMLLMSTVRMVTAVAAIMIVPMTAMRVLLAMIQTAAP